MRKTEGTGLAIRENDGDGDGDGDGGGDGGGDGDVGCQEGGGWGTTFNAMQRRISPSWRRRARTWGFFMPTGGYLLNVHSDTWASRGTRSSRTDDRAAACHDDGTDCPLGRWHNGSSRLRKCPLGGYMASSWRHGHEQEMSPRGWLHGRVEAIDGRFAAAPSVEGDEDDRQSAVEVVAQQRASAAASSSEKQARNAAAQIF